MTFYKSVKEEIENRGMDCVPMSPDVREMRMDAVRQKSHSVMAGSRYMLHCRQSVRCCCMHGIMGLRPCQRMSHSVMDHMYWT